RHLATRTAWVLAEESQFTYVRCRYLDDCPVGRNRRGKPGEDSTCILAAARGPDRLNLDKGDFHPIAAGEGAVHGRLGVWSVGTARRDRARASRARAEADVGCCQRRRA